MLPPSMNDLAKDLGVSKSTLQREKNEAIFDSLPHEVKARLKDMLDELSHYGINLGNFELKNFGSSTFKLKKLITTTTIGIQLPIYNASLWLKVTVDAYSGKCDTGFEPEYSMFVNQKPNLYRNKTHDRLYDEGSTNNLWDVAYVLQNPGVGAATRRLR